MSSGDQSTSTPPLRLSLSQSFSILRRNGYWAEANPSSASSSCSYYLSSLIGDFLIERPPGSSNLTLSSALSILPTTVQGLNVNPSFLAHSSFVPEGDGGELALFELCGVKLTHGWVVDSEEDKELFGRVGAWDACQARMVEGQVAEGELERTGGVDESGMGKIEDGQFGLALLSLARRPTDTSLLTL